MLRLVMQHLLPDGDALATLRHEVQHGLINGIEFIARHRIHHHRQAGHAAAMYTCL